MDELGIKGYEASGWYGIHGPRGVQKAVVEKLNATARVIVGMPDILERFGGLNLEPVSSTQEEFSQFIRADLLKYAQVAKKAGIQPQ